MSDQHGPLRFVVPVDRHSEADDALAYAAVIARPGDEILILHAVPLSDINPVVVPQRVSIASLREQVLSDAEEHVMAVATKFEPPADVTVRTLAMDGTPAEAIVEHAPSPESSMIIMSTHGRGVIGRLTYGSVADRVSRTSHAPVLLIRFDEHREATARAEITRLVVPLDGSERSKQVLPQAINLAKRLEVPVLLVSVAEIERLAAVYGTTLSAAAYSEISGEAESEVLAMLDAVAERVRAEGIEVDVRVMAGAVTAGIEAVTVPGDVIVMTSHGRGGVRRWIIGSVAEQLARTAKVPVMLVPSM